MARVASRADREVISAFMVVSVTLLSLSIAATFHSEYIRSLALLFTEEDFEYLIVVLIVDALILYSSLAESGYSIGLSPPRLVASLLLVIMSLLMYFLSKVSPEYLVQLEGASFVLLYLSLFLIIFSPRTYRDALPLLGMLLLIPIPPSILDSITPPLSRILGRLAAATTGSVFVEKPGFSLIAVETPKGVAYFQVEHACTGIVTMSSVLAVVPAILYMIAYSSRPLRARILAGLLASMAGVLVGLLGNYIRILLVIIGSKALGPERGLEAFHYTPSIVYSIIAVLIAFKIAYRLGGVSVSLPRLGWGSRGVLVSGLGSVLLALLALSTLFAGTASWVDSRAHLPEESGPALSFTAPSLKDFIEESAGLILESANMSAVTILSDERLTEILNAIAVFRVTARHGGTLYSGYVEIADTPTRLHTWQLCLTLQGYNVTESYTKVYNGTTIYYVIASKHDRGFILAFSYYPLEVIAGDMTWHLYARVSFFTYYKPAGVEEAEYKLGSILSSIAASPSGTRARLTYYDAIYATSLLSYLLLGLLPVVRYLYRIREHGIRPGSLGERAARGLERCQR